MPRYLFAIPEQDKPVGGINVALQCVNVLKKQGYEAAPLYGNSDYSYDFIPFDGTAYYHPHLVALTKGAMRRQPRTIRVRAFVNGLRKKRGTAKNTLMDLRPDDVIVTSEFWYPECRAAFPDNPCVLLCQDVFGFARAFRRDLATGTRMIDTFAAIVTTSQAAQAAVKGLAKLESHPIPQSVSTPDLAFGAQKKRQILYMPRKRAAEIDLLLGCLKGNPAFEGWAFVPIDGLPDRAQVDALLRESLIFLSFSHQEGFGLPPAEAMAAGCITIGYTGVGGEEFFTPDVGLPILDSDIAGFAATLEAVVQEYDRDPARLDALRTRASETIHSRYTPGAMEAGLKQAWAAIDAAVRQAPGPA